MYANPDRAEQFQEHASAIVNREAVETGREVSLADRIVAGKRQLRSLVEGGLVSTADYPQAISAFQQWMEDKPVDEDFDSHMHRFFTMYEEAEYVVPPEVI